MSEKTFKQSVEKRLRARAAELARIKAQEQAGENQKRAREEEVGNIVRRGLENKYGRFGANVHFEVHEAETDPDQPTAYRYILHVHFSDSSNVRLNGTVCFGETGLSFTESWTAYSWSAEKSWVRVGESDDFLDAAIAAMGY